MNAAYRLAQAGCQLAQITGYSLVAAVALALLAPAILLMHLCAFLTPEPFSPTAATNVTLPTPFVPARPLSESGYRHVA